MRGLIDTIFAPFLKFLEMIYNNISMLQVPLSRPLDLGKYLGPFVLLGGGWITFITVSFLCGAIYLVTFIVFITRGEFVWNKKMIKWW